MIDISWWDRFLGSDPGLNQLRNALQAEASTEPGHRRDEAFGLTPWPRASI